MENITLNHEQWFKIFMLFDTIDNETDLNKNFLLFTEYYKALTRGVMTVYVSSVESLTPSPESELGQCFSERDSINNSDQSEDEKTEHLMLLQDKYSEVLVEHGLHQTEVNEIVQTPFTILCQKIPQYLLPDLPEEYMEVLSPIINLENDNE